MRRPVALACALILLATGCEPAPPPATLIIGDSNTGGTSWATMLGAACSPGVWAWGGTGILRSGYTGGVGPLRLVDMHRDILDSFPAGQHVVIVLGTNDAVTAGALPTLDDLNAIAAAMRSEGAASVRWATIPPLGPQRSQTERDRVIWLNAVILQTPDAVDLRSALGTTLDPGEQVGDGIHLSADGHGRVAWIAAGSAIC